MTYDEILIRLKTLARPGAAECAAEIGIRPRTKLYGVKGDELRRMARQIGVNPLLAERLWLADVHDARLLAPLIADPRLVNEGQMERWAAGFDAWDLCDQVCGQLFRQTPFAYSKAAAWSKRREEFVKRAAFALMATLATPGYGDDEEERFLQFLLIIRREAIDERANVHKAIAWALRQIGRRSPSLRRQAIQVAEVFQNSPVRAAQWIAEETLPRLTGVITPPRP